MFYKVPLGVAMADTPAAATTEPVLSGFRMAPNSVAVVFCGGTGRCGTNVLKRVFARHPEVYTLPFEIRFLLDPGGIIDFYTSHSAQFSQRSCRTGANPSSPDAKGTQVNWVGPAGYRAWAIKTFAAHEDVAIKIGLWKKN